VKGYGLTTGNVGSPWISVPANNLTAAGTTQGNAYQIPSGQDFSVFTTAASGTGATLPASGVSIGEYYTIANHGGNVMAIYPQVGGKIGTLATNGAYNLAAGNAVSFCYVSNLVWCVGV
jgi:hypothetical protein